MAIVPSDPRGIRRPPLKFDGKEHAPYRTALDRTLKASRLKRLAPLLEAHADDESAVLATRGHGDICVNFGARFSGWVEKEWLNLEVEDAEVLMKNVLPFTQSYRTQDWPAVRAASEEFYKIARKVFAEKKVKPMDPEEDPASSLLLERDHEGKPLDEELLM
jgi:cytochrome P450